MLMARDSTPRSARVGAALGAKLSSQGHATHVDTDVCCAYLVADSLSLDG